MVDGSLEAGEAPRLDKKGGEGVLQAVRASLPCCHTERWVCARTKHKSAALPPFIANQNPSLSEKKNTHTGWATNTHL